jgi:hypothetical protein
MGRRAGRCDRVEGLRFPSARLSTRPSSQSDLASHGQRIDSRHPQRPAQPRQRRRTVRSNRRRSIARASGDLTGIPQLGQDGSAASSTRRSWARILCVETPSVSRAVHHFASGARATFQTASDPPGNVGQATAGGRSGFGELLEVRPLRLPGLRSPASENLPTPIRTPLKPGPFGARQAL